MDKLFRLICDRLTAGEDLMLGTIIAGSGSTPRGAGAKMVITADGSSHGTIGGGAVEFEAQRMAREALSQGRSLTHYFDLSPNQVADLGMICGGSVTVYFQYVSGGDPRGLEFFGEVMRLAAIDSNSWLITEITPDGGWTMASVDSSRRVTAGSFSGSGEELENMLRSVCVLDKAGESLRYCQPLVRAGRAIIFGGGHITQQLVPVLTRVFFPCVVVDSQPEFTDAALFPEAREIYLAEFDQVFGELSVRESDYIVIVTRGHQYDYEVLREALRTPACYIGMIGSRRKIDATYQRLITEEGFTMADIRRVNAPIGLDIGGETPEEISISIAAQMIERRTKRDGR